MSKTTKIIAALGVVAGLGVAALPAFTYAETVSGDAQVLVEVESAIAMQIEGNNDSGTEHSGTFAAGTPSSDPAAEGFYERLGSAGAYTYEVTGDNTVDPSKTYYKPVEPTYGVAKAYSPSGATTIDGQALTNFTLDYAANTSSSYISLLPNAKIEGDMSATTPDNSFGSKITVWTNHASGYTLSVIDKDDDTSLTHSSGAYYIPTGASAVVEGTAKWNFDSTPGSDSDYSGKTAQAMPAAGGTAVEINQTSTKTNGGSITYVDYNVSTAADQATCIYSDTIVYTATSN